MKYAFSTSTCLSATDIYYFCSCQQPMLLRPYITFHHDQLFDTSQIGTIQHHRTSVNLSSSKKLASKFVNFYINIYGKKVFLY